MQKVLKSILSLCLAVAICLGIPAITNTAVTGYVVADAATVNTYYSGITAKNGTALLGQIHDLIVSTHTTYTSYDDCKRYGPTTDPGLDGKGVMEFYTHETIMNFVGGVGDWNREHVWCQSLSNGLWGTGGGGSDLHHIRPSESGLNSTRGNNKYGYAKDGGKEAWSRDNDKNNSKLGGWYIGNSIFEPLDNVKGDAARIVMYVYTHYNNASNVGGTKESARTHGNLNFTNVISASNEAAAIELLLEWNKLDPVDEIEMYRNETVYKIQGNRNPFIDNSSYADAIWGNGTVVDPDNPTPSDTLKSISLNTTALNLNVGDTQALTVTPNPSNASASVTWTSSDTSVATVSNGKVVAIAEGTATITATSSVNSSIKATATVTVKQSSSETTDGKVTITRSSFTNASSAYGNYFWSSGAIEGTAYIYGGNSDAMQFNTSKTSQYLASSKTKGTIKKVTINANGNSSWTLLTSNQPYSAVTSGNPLNGNTHDEDTSNSGTWTVSGSDTYFALVLGGSGAAYINSIEVEYETNGSTVTPPEPPELESISITPSSVTLEEGDSTKLIVESVPSTVTAEVSWTSSDPSVATVSSDGTVTAVKAGTATITATDSTDSEISSTATVTVTAKPVPPPVETLEILPNPITIKEGNSFNMSVEGYPDSDIIWSSSDETVAVVDRYSNIVGCKVGQCEITATLISDSTVQGTAHVTVIRGDDVQVSISHTTEIQLQVGETEQLQAIFYPDDKSVSVSWLSSDESVVTIDSNGLITAVGAGTAKITLTNNVNPDISDSQTVVVIDTSSDSGNVQKFTDAFEKIAEAQTMSDMHYSIVNAVRTYNSLSADEKQSVAQQKEALEVVIEAYNALVDAANSAAAEAEANALGGFKG